MKIYLAWLASLIPKLKFSAAMIQVEALAAKEDFPAAIYSPRLWKEVSSRVSEFEDNEEPWSENERLGEILSWKPNREWIEEVWLAEIVAQT